jgi:hypothetical protein
MPRSSGFSLLFIGDVPFSEHGSASLTKGFRVFSQFHEDIAGIVPHIISFHILPDLFFTFHPNIPRCVVRAAARIVALAVIWMSVSLDCSLTSCDVCETSMRFIDYLDSCKV